MTLSTREAARRFELHAARGLASHAKERKQDLQRAVNDIARGLRALKECNPDPVRFADIAGFVIDAASEIDAACMSDIDEASEHAEPVDLTELRELAQ